MTIQENIAKMLSGQMGMLEIEREIRHAVVLQALRLCGGNQCKAALMLKTHRNNLCRVLKEMREEGILIPPRHNLIPKHIQREHRAKTLMRRRRKPPTSDPVDYFSPDGAKEAAEKGWEPKDFVTPENGH